MGGGGGWGRAQDVKETSLYFVCLFVFFNFLKISVKLILQFPSCSLQKKKKTTAPISATSDQIALLDVTMVDFSLAILVTSTVILNCCYGKIVLSRWYGPYQAVRHFLVFWCIAFNSEHNRYIILISSVQYSSFCVPLKYSKRG